MAESLFKVNTQLIRRLRVQARIENAINRIWAALQKWANEWARRAARVTPVETGQLRRNYFVVPIRNGTHFTIILANHMQYGKWLEFGTRNIAHGDVLAWKQGDPPVMQWPAKAANLQCPKRSTEKSLARWHARMEGAMTVGQGEQMPMVRPTGYELVPLIIADVRGIVKKELGKSA